MLRRQYLNINKQAAIVNCQPNAGADFHQSSLLIDFEDETTMDGEAEIEIGRISWMEYFENEAEEEYNPSSQA